MKKRIEKILSYFDRKKEELIPILQKVQWEVGYLPDEAMLEISKHTKVPESKVFAVATFYAQFRFAPIGKKHIMVCRGTACYVKGSTRILEAIENRIGIKEGETTKDMEYSLETVACIGACGLSPCIMVNKDVKAKLTPKKIRDLFPRNKK